MKNMDKYNDTSNASVVASEAFVQALESAATHKIVQKLFSRFAV